MFAVWISSKIVGFWSLRSHPDAMNAPPLSPYPCQLITDDVILFTKTEWPLFTNDVWVPLPAVHLVGVVGIAAFARRTSGVSFGSLGASSFIKSVERKYLNEGEPVN